MSSCLGLSCHNGQTYTKKISKFTWNSEANDGKQSRISFDSSWLTPAVGTCTLWWFSCSKLNFVLKSASQTIVQKTELLFIMQINVNDLLTNLQLFSWRLNVPMREKRLWEGTSGWGVKICRYSKQLQQYWVEKYILLIFFLSMYSWAQNFKHSLQ